MHTTPRFLQGVYTFSGQGLEKPVPIDSALSYVVPPGMTAQPVYFRGGNSTPEMVCVVLLRDGIPMRYFPIGARADTHVALRVVEDLLGDARIDLHLLAPMGCSGVLIVDLGLVEL